MSQTIKFKRGLNANLTSLTLQAGEPAFVTDTGKFYIGDGTNKILINPDKGAVASADKWTTPRTLTVGGDVSGSVIIDGSEDKTLDITVTDNSHNHTASNISDFASSVRALAITGLSTATNAVITATDTILGAFGKLQAQITANLSTLTTHTGSTSNPHSTTASQVGLGNVTNESKATMFTNPAFTGVPTAPTATTGTNTTQVATTAFVTSAIATIDGGTF